MGPTEEVPYLPREMAPAQFAALAKRNEIAMNGTMERWIDSGENPNVFDEAEMVQIMNRTYEIFVSGNPEPQTPEVVERWTDAGVTVSVRVCVCVTVTV